jgi:pimeloyl-ACP methyl ester carboxylesterase
VCHTASCAGTAVREHQPRSGETIADRVRVPVLLITAGDGLPADMARTRELIARLELARTVGTGHFAHVFAPEQVNAMIDKFLTVH